MPVKVEFREHEHIILLVCEGKTTYRDLQVATEQANEYAKPHNCYNILVDACRIEPVVAAYEIYDFPRFYSSLGIPRTARVAVVAPTITRKEDDFRFYETVCKNNGFTVETFDELESAKRWLAEKAT